MEGNNFNRLKKITLPFVVFVICSTIGSILYFRHTHENMEGKYPFPEQAEFYATAWALSSDTRVKVEDEDVEVLKKIWNGIKYKDPRLKSEDIEDSYIIYGEHKGFSFSFPNDDEFSTFYLSEDGIRPNVRKGVFYDGKESLAVYISEKDYETYFNLIMKYLDTLPYRERWQ